jgi:hypothetical protein
MTGMVHTDVFSKSLSARYSAEGGFEPVDLRPVSTCYGAVDSYDIFYKGEGGFQGTVGLVLCI